MEPACGENWYQTPLILPAGRVHWCCPRPACVSNTHQHHPLGSTLGASHPLIQGRLGTDCLQTFWSRSTLGFAIPHQTRSVSEQGWNSESPLILGWGPRTSAFPSLVQASGWGFILKSKPHRIRNQKDFFSPYLFKTEALLPLGSWGFWLSICCVWAKWKPVGGSGCFQHQVVPAQGPSIPPGLIGRSHQEGCD